MSLRPPEGSLGRKLEILTSGTYASVFIDAIYHLHKTRDTEGLNEDALRENLRHANEEIGVYLKNPDLHAGLGRRDSPLRTAIQRDSFQRYLAMRQQKGKPKTELKTVSKTLKDLVANRKVGERRIDQALDFLRGYAEFALGDCHRPPEGDFLDYYEYGLRETG